MIVCLEEKSRFLEDVDSNRIECLHDAQISGLKCFDRGPSPLRIQ